MINILLIFPIVAAILVLIIKNKKFDIAMVNLYALIHFIIAVLICAGGLETAQTKYFAVDGTNLIFLLVLSVVNGAVAIYNTGYARTFDVPDRRISHYSFVEVRFHHMTTYRLVVL